jgi:hypothetical protein
MRQVNAVVVSCHKSNRQLEKAILVIVRRTLRPMCLMFPKYLRLVLRSQRKYSTSTELRRCNRYKKNVQLEELVELGRVRAERHVLDAEEEPLVRQRYLGGREHGLWRSPGTPRPRPQRSPASPAATPRGRGHVAELVVHDDAALDAGEPRGHPRPSASCLRIASTPGRSATAPDRCRGSGAPVRWGRVRVRLRYEAAGR